MHPPTPRQNIQGQLSAHFIRRSIDMAQMFLQRLSRLLVVCWMESHSVSLAQASESCSRTSQMWNTDSTPALCCSMSRCRSCDYRRARSTLRRWRWEGQHQRIPTPPRLPAQRAQPWAHFRLGSSNTGCVSHLCATFTLQPLTQNPSTGNTGMGLLNGRGEGGRARGSSLRACHPRLWGGLGSTPDHRLQGPQMQTWLWEAFHRKPSCQQDPTR